MITLSMQISTVHVSQIYLLLQALLNIQEIIHCVKEAMQ